MYISTLLKYSMILNIDILNVSLDWACLKHPDWLKNSKANQIA